MNMPGSGNRAWAGLGGLHLSMHGGGPNLFPPWTSVLWAILFGAALAVHCWHFIRLGGERRWYHGSHVLMAIGMIYMALALGYRWTWFPSDGWEVVYACSTVMVLGWLAMRMLVFQPVNALWILVAVQQAAMIYMYSPRMVAGLSWVLVGWFALEAAGWTSGVLLDGSRRHSTLLPLAIGPSYTAVVATSAGTVVEVAEPSTVVDLVECPPILWTRVAMAVMALGMAYMFAGMQLVS
jgi:hypothetical protein